MLILELLQKGYFGISLFTPRASSLWLTVMIYQPLLATKYAWGVHLGLLSLHDVMLSLIIHLPGQAHV